MKHASIRRYVLFFVAVTMVIGGSRTGSSATTSKDAPLDQYFGTMKLSALGIRDRIDALGRRYHARTITDDDLVHDAKIAESAFYDWQTHFPNDGWIVPTAYHLEQLYQAVQSTEARAHATSLLKFIATKYPKTGQAHLSRIRLAQGLPALRPETATHATPNPYAHDSAGQTPSASSSPAPTISSSPSA
ncbi:MAG: hypothetical protein IAI49_04350, partial [Candidatus Eremiobacteraeota bacterium]|nr:hypothetical protein [Candidatus Eremiobacteraeota bacterium]